MVKWLLLQIDLNIEKMHSLIAGTGHGRQNGNLAKSARIPRATTPLDKPHRHPEEDSCSHCGSMSKKDGSNKSCWALIFLLAVDAFTIGLVIALFSHHHFHAGLPL